jgi:PKD repeat protein
MFNKIQFLMFVVNKIKRKASFIVALLIIASVAPLIVIRAQAALSAGPDQQVYTGETVTFNGTTTENVTSIIQVTWDFGDNTTAVNGTSATLLNATHIYTTTGIYNTTLTVKFNSALNKTEIATTTITVNENQPPIASAGPDQNVEQNSPQGSSVTLNGTGSSDPNNDTLTYFWNWTGGSANGDTPTALFPVGNTTVTLIVSDSQYNATDTVSIVVQADTTVPLVNAGPDVTVEQESHAGTQVILNGTATDLVSTLFNFTWSENGMVLKAEENATTTMLVYTFNLGTRIVTLNATDDAGNIGSDNVTITIIDTIPPVVNAGPDMTVEQESQAGTQVTLYGDATDICSTQFNFTWSENGVVLGTEQNLTYTFNLGTHTVTLNATDMAGNTGSDNVTVTVVDTTPPEINASATPSILWPPNHKYVQVEATVTAQDAGDPSPTVTFVSVTSNEPDNGKGDGNTINDIVIVDDYTFEFRAERSGNGAGRVYTITYRATDASGNSAEASLTITVPHNK